MNAPILQCAQRVTAATRPNGRALKATAGMYREARGILSRGISFSREEALAKAEAALKALETTRDNQLHGVWGPKTTAAQGARAEAKVIALYEKELAEIQGQITELKATE